MEFHGRNRGEGKEVFQLMAVPDPPWKALALHVRCQTLVFILNLLTHSLELTEQKVKETAADRFFTVTKYDGNDSGLIIQRNHLCQSNCLWREKNKSFSKIPSLPNLVQCHHLKCQVFHLAKASHGKAQRQFTQLAWAGSLFFNYILWVFPQSVVQTVLL